jgi:uncharacterized protein YegL
MYYPGLHPGPQTPLQILGDVVPELVWQIAAEPLICDAVRIGLVSFHDVAEVMVPLNPPEKIKNLGSFPKGNQTNYAGVFETLYTRIAEDCALLAHTHKVMQPAVFFLTDGVPYVGAGEQKEGEWLPARQRLDAPDFSFRPKIIAFGFGGAEREVLCKVGSTQGTQSLAFIAKDGAGVGEVLSALMQTIYKSISNTVDKGELSISLPDGMQWARPVT